MSMHNATEGKTMKPTTGILAATLIVLTAASALARDNPTVAPPSAGAFGPMSFGRPQP